MIDLCILKNSGLTMAYCNDQTNITVNFCIKICTISTSLTSVPSCIFHEGLLSPWVLSEIGILGASTTSETTSQSVAVLQRNLWRQLTSFGAEQSYVRNRLLHALWMEIWERLMVTLCTKSPNRKDGRREVHQRQREKSTHWDPDVIQQKESESWLEWGSSERVNGEV